LLVRISGKVVVGVTYYYAPPALTLLLGGSRRRLQFAQHRIQIQAMLGRHFFYGAGASATGIHIQAVENGQRPWVPLDDFINGHVSGYPFF